MLNDTNKTTTFPKIAVLSSWNESCGIASYSKNLYSYMNANIKIFSELTNRSDGMSIPCWSRGKLLDKAAKCILKFNPDVIIIEYEPGLFQHIKYLQPILDLNIPVISNYHLMNKQLGEELVNNKFAGAFIHHNNWMKYIDGEDLPYIFNVPHGCEIAYKFNGIDKLKSFLGWDLNKFHIVTLGYISPRKMTLENVKLIKNLKRHNKEIVYHIFGGSQNVRSRYWVNDRRYMRTILMQTKNDPKFDINFNELNVDNIHMIAAAADLLLFNGGEINWKSVSGIAQYTFTYKKPSLLSSTTLFDEFNNTNSFKFTHLGTSEIEFAFDNYDYFEKKFRGTLNDSYYIKKYDILSNNKLALICKIIDEY